MNLVCIYCTHEKSEEAFSRVEHVIPQSFGKFENNLTLKCIVCDNCNQYFGDHLEIALARDTFEGASRFTYGIKEPAEFRPFGRQSRIVLTIAEGAFKGAYAFREYERESDKITLRPLPQIGFRRGDNGVYEYYLVEDIPDEKTLKEKFDLKQPESIRSLALEEKEVAKIVNARGIGYKPGGELVPPDKSESILAEMAGVIDITIFRAVAKIALNYLAYWQGREFLLESAFDALRYYVREGRKPPFQIVTVTGEGILEDEKEAAKERRLGHLITMNWAKDGVSILGQVSLFNWATYKVSLARDYKGIKRDLRRGTFFNVARGQIIELAVREQATGQKANIAS